MLSFAKVQIQIMIDTGALLSTFSWFVGFNTNYRRGEKALSFSRHVYTYIDLHDFGGNVLNLLFQGSNDIIDGLCTITLGPHLRKITCNVIRIRINCLRS